MPALEDTTSLFGPVGTPLANLGIGVGAILGGLGQREANTKYSQLVTAWSNEYAKWSKHPDPAVREQMARKLTKAYEWIEKHPQTIAPLMRQANKASDAFKQAIVTGLRPDASPADRLHAETLLNQYAESPEVLQALSQFHTIDYNNLSPEEIGKLTKPIIKSLTEGVEKSFISQAIEGLGGEELPPEAKEAAFLTGGDIPAARQILGKKFKLETGLKGTELGFKEEERERAKLKSLASVDLVRQEMLAKEGIRKIDLAIQVLGKGTGFDALLAQKVPGLNVPFKQALTDVFMNRLFIKSGANVPTTEDIKQEKATIDLFQSEEELRGTLQDIRTSFTDVLSAQRRGTGIEEKEGGITPSAVGTKGKSSKEEVVPDFSNLRNLKFR